MLIVVSALQAVVIAIVAAIPPMTLVGAAVLSLLFTISSAATFALIPVLSGALGMTLARANSYLEIVRSLGMLAGPVAGGILIGWIGASNALMVDATSFAVLCCGSAWKRDPGSGVIGVEKGPLIPVV